MYIVVFLVVLVTGCIAFILRREAISPGPRPGGVRGFLRARGWALLLIPVAMMAAVMEGGAHQLVPVELGLTFLGIVFAPKLAARAVPYAVLVLGVVGLKLDSAYFSGNTSRVLYGLVPAGNGSWGTRLVLPQALVFFAVGLWLLLQVQAPGSGPVRALAAQWLDRGRGGIAPAHALLLIPVMVLVLLLAGPRNWFDMPKSEISAVVLIDGAIAAASVVLVFRSRIWAATVAEAGLLVLGAYGLLIAAFWPHMPGLAYGLSPLSHPGAALGGAVQGTALLALGVWLVPRMMREHLTAGSAPELAARAQQLTQRVQTLTQTRSDAVDTAAAELRRIERDLHDGAQARLVALGMSLQAAERLFPASPEAAMALITEAKENSSRALTELRDLVRGIYPPVLADRGLGDAIRALALDTPLHTVVDIDLPGTVELPVASAVYFSVAEALANVAKHAEARSARIAVRHSVANHGVANHGVANHGVANHGVANHGAGMLRAEVTDDGAGGADPALGTGLAGVERRLATFDGILAVNSPPGGPTIVVIEVPCALSSAKTFTC
jgi:signal transduction histidine kinase